MRTSMRGGMAGALARRPGSAGAAQPRRKTLTAIRTVSSILSRLAARGIAGQPAQLVLADQHVEKQHGQPIGIFLDEASVLLLLGDPAATML